MILMYAEALWDALVPGDVFPTCHLRVSRNKHTVQPIDIMC